MMMIDDVDRMMIGWWCQYIHCWTFLIFILLMMLDLWPQAETQGVTHFGAYHRPPDGQFSMFYVLCSMFYVDSRDCDIFADCNKRLDSDNDNPMRWSNESCKKSSPYPLPLKTNPSPAPLIYAYSSPLKRREDNAHLPWHRQPMFTPPTSHPWEYLAPEKLSSVYIKPVTDLKHI